MRLLFFSSDSLGVPLLKALVKDEGFSVEGVFCQPDRPSGRNQDMKMAPSKIVAEALGIPCYQPESLKEAKDLLEKLAQNPPDLLLTFSYGQILPKTWLGLPRLAPLNVHPSLLPKYRGPSPLHATLLNGDLESGISLMKMVSKMDAGPLVAQMRFEVPQGVFIEEYEKFIAELSAQWVPEQLLNIGVFEEQSEEGLSYTQKLSREDGFVDFSERSEKIYRKFLAYHPWPGLWTLAKGKRVKLLDLKPASLELSFGETLEKEERFFIGCGEGSLELLRLQLEGKEAQSAQDFMRGRGDLLRVLGRKEDEN